MSRLRPESNVGLLRRVLDVQLDETRRPLPDAFVPRLRDRGRLSVLRADRVTPEEARAQGSPAHRYGVAEVSTVHVAEAGRLAPQVDLHVDEDRPPHCAIVFGVAGEADRRRIARRLAELAVPPAPWATFEG